MNADNYFQSDEILNIINKNYNEKITNLRVLNSFKTLYGITGKYEKNTIYISNSIGSMCNADQLSGIGYSHQ